MTIKEANDFYYNGDIYLQNRVKDLFNWLESSIKDGYETELGLVDFKNLINKIVNWYEIKYPEREYSAKKGTTFVGLNEVESLADYLSVDELMYRLEEDEINLLNCPYRGSIFGPSMSDGKESMYTGIEITKLKENKSIYGSLAFYVMIDCFSGKVLYTNITGEFDLPNEKGMPIEEMLKRYQESYKDSLGLNELKKLIYIHETDIELRHRLLELVALKLLYSKNTIPEHGYDRAIKFINEFNERFELTLSDEEINELYQETKLTRKK